MWKTAAYFGFGAIIGTIVDTTSTLPSTSLLKPGSSQVRDNSISVNSPGPLYYHCESEVFAAFLSCLLTDNGFPVQDQRFCYLPLDSSPHMTIQYLAVCPLRGVRWRGMHFVYFRKGPRLIRVTATRQSQAKTPSY